MGYYKETRPVFESIVQFDVTGRTYPCLVSIYLACGDVVALQYLLKLGMQKFPNDPYFPAMKASIDIIIGSSPPELKHYENLKDIHIVDSAIYIKTHAAAGLCIVGTTFQTFDVIREIVPTSGIICEFGVRNGHSINHIAEIFPQRHVFGFDSFEGLPESWDDEPSGSYTTKGRLPAVPNNVTLIKGLFDATLPDFVKSLDGPVALINVDCDIYSSTKTIFEYLGPFILPDTMIVFDEYICNKNWREDEFKAFQEWVAAYGVEYRYITASVYTKQVSVQILKKTS